MVLCHGVVTMVGAPKAICVAHPFAVIRQAHLGAPQLLRYTVGMSHAHQHVIDAQVEHNIWFENAVDQGGFAFQ